MKISNEQKETLKSVGKKATEALSEDIKQADPKSIKRPVVMLLMVVAVVGVLRDPMTLLIGIVAAILVALAMSTTSDDLKKLFFDQSKKDAPKEEKTSDPKEEKAP